MQNFYSRLAPSLVALLELALMAATGFLIVRAQRRSISRHGPATAWQGIVWQKIVRWCARRPLLAVLALGSSVILLRVALIPLLGVPQPRWNDEFSYLLAADTFVHGRLTNPTHPMWIHFESFHIIEHPTYMSMYPPAQGLMLAFGRLLGQAWIGQLLITGAFCSALYWMSQAWMPQRWALLGGVLAALRLAILSYWMNSYWCASVAAFGGALVLGAWPRLRRAGRVRDAVIMGAGLVILANSRPYEGLVFSLPVAAAMLVWLRGLDRDLLKNTLQRAISPLAVVLLMGAAATSFYYFRVTGSPWVMTYQVNRGQYAMAPYFIWQQPRPEPQYHHAVMRDYYQWELKEFNRNRTLAGYTQRAWEKILGLWQFYLGPLLTVSLLGLPWVVRDRKMWLPLWILGTMAAGFAVQTWTLAHYFSPATSALYIVLVQGLRHLRLWRQHTGGAGRAVVRAVPMLAAAMILLRVAAVATHTQIEPQWPRGNLERAAIVRELTRMPGEHLIVVRYGGHHDVDHEWVWNDASIDAAKIVWARDMGEVQNSELVRYFLHRRVWRIDGDDPQPELQVYPFNDARN